MSGDVAQLSIKVDSTDVRRSDKDMDAMARSAEKAEKYVGRMIAAMGGMYAAVRTMQAAANEAKNFEYAMATVATVIDDKSKIPALSAQIRELSEEMGQMPTDSAKAMYDIVSSGATDSAKALDILATSQKLAVGGATEVGVAADGLTSIMAVYASSVRNATEVADKMFVSAAVGKTTIGELSHHIGMVAPIANTAGVSLSELLAAVGTLTKGGMNTAAAVTGIRSFLAQVVKHGDDASKAAKQVGFDYDVAALKAKGLLGFVEDLKAKTGGDPAMMGRIVGDIEGLTAAMSLTGPMSQSFNDAMGSMAGAAGKTQEAFATMADTSQVKLNQFLAKLSNEAIDAGRKLLQMVPADGLLKNFDALASGVYGLAKVFAILLAMKAAGWAAEWIATMKMKIDIMIAARGHSIAMAQGDLAEANASLAAAQAHTARARAAFQAASGYPNIIAASRVMGDALAEESVATNAQAVALARLKAEQSLTTPVANGLKGAMAALGGPVGIITAALMLGAWAWSAWADSAEKARAQAQQVAMAKGDSAASAVKLVADLRSEMDAMSKAKDGSKEAKDAASKIADAKRELMALGPQYRQLLQDETKSARDLADQLERVARFDAAEVQKQINALESRKSSVVARNQQVIADQSSDDSRNSSNTSRTSWFNNFGYNISRSRLKAEYDVIEEQLNQLYAKRGQFEKAVVAQPGTSAGNAKAPIIPNEEAAKEYKRQADFVKNLNTELSELGKTEREVLSYRIEQAKLNPEMARVAGYFADQLAARKALLKVEEDLKKLRPPTDEVYDAPKAFNPSDYASLRSANGLLKLGKDLNDKYQDPAVKMGIEAKQLDEMLAKNIISLDVFKKRMRDVRYEGDATWRFLEDAGMRVADGLADAFARMATGAKVSFKELTASILADIARMESQRGFAALLNMGLSAWAGSQATTTTNYNPTALDPITVGPVGGGSNLNPLGSRTGTSETTVTVTINNNGTGGGGASTSVEGSGRFGADLGDAIGKLVDRKLVESRRPGGLLYGVTA